MDQTSLRVPIQNCETNRLSIWSLPARDSTTQDTAHTHTHTHPASSGFQNLDPSVPAV